MVIFLVSTWGDGEPTRDADSFYEYMNDKKHPSNLLKNLKYSVFGLGDRRYELFNQMGIDTDKALLRYNNAGFLKMGVHDFTNSRKKIPVLRSFKIKTN